MNVFVTGVPAVLGSGGAVRMSKNAQTEVGDEVKFEDHKPSRLSSENLAPMLSGCSCFSLQGVKKRQARLLISFFSVFENTFFNPYLYTAKKKKKLT